MAKNGLRPLPGSQGLGPWRRGETAVFENCMTAVAFRVPLTRGPPITRPLTLRDQTAARAPIGKASRKGLAARGAAITAATPDAAACGASQARELSISNFFHA